MLLSLRVIFYIVNFIYTILRRVKLLICKKPPSIQPIKDPLFTLSASTLARKIRQKEITSYDVVNAYITRIQELKSLNAVVDNRFADAIKEAKICDEELKAGKFDAETLEKEKPFYGVPFTVKECLSVKGCSLTGGNLFYKGIKAKQDGAAIELLRNAGAIPLCVTNTPEMCGGIDSMNLLYGRTRNPYDARYSAGGSSGGEGALLGAGASIFGIGSDLGGSIRIPSLFNGVFGHKPTTGIISIAGHFPLMDDKIFRSMLSVGPMVRYAEDLKPILRVLTSKCERDLRLNVPVDLKQLRVYYRQGMDKSFGILPVAPEVEECVLKAANHFAQYGIRPDKLPIEWPATMVEIALSGCMSIRDIPLLVDDKGPKKHIYAELMKGMFGLSQHTIQLLFFAMFMESQFPFSASDIKQYNKQGEIIRQKLEDLLGEDGIFIYPTFFGHAFFAGHILCEMLGMTYCSIFNTFGFPSVHVPMGLNRAGLPIGVQVIAAPYQDRLCVAVAKELEEAFGGWVPPSISISD